ncbi:hypothetical protein V473_17755 [Sphingobium cupriresistens LL01]|uniref:Uncharacterized protein n=1 Tax=Sphingobium cupriresistens LL01 TaxID=1420583 RepID=A0A0J7XT27_9SPHN|nr:hypothetical protein V473_17755 [Sphingobium cupriresistens LL01]
MALAACKGRNIAHTMALRHGKDIQCIEVRGESFNSTILVVEQQQSSPFDAPIARESQNIGCMSMFPRHMVVMSCEEVAWTVTGRLAIGETNGAVSGNGPYQFDDRQT